jgi:predicted transcriptional regulator
MLWKIQQRLHYLDSLLALQATGTPKELAKKLQITERAWYNLRDELVHDLHIPIIYDTKQRSYVYLEKGCLKMGFHRSVQTSK